MKKILALLSSTLLGTNLISNINSNTKINNFDNSIGPFINYSKKEILNQSQKKQSYSKSLKFTTEFLNYGKYGSYKNFEDFCNQEEPSFAFVYYSVDAAIGDESKWKETNDWLQGDEENDWHNGLVRYYEIEHFMSVKQQIINLSWTSGNGLRNTFVKVNEWFSDDVQNKTLNINWEYEMENSNKVEPVNLKIIL